MSIKRVKVSNFKSFAELDVELRPFNLVVGANAAGKSNFLEIFRFLRDLAVDGLPNAVSLQGGMGYLANVGLGADRTALEVEIDDPGVNRLVASAGYEIASGDALASNYRISFGGVAPGLAKIFSETITQRFQFGLVRTTSPFVEEEIGSGEATWTKGPDGEYLDAFPAMFSPNLAESIKDKLSHTMRDQAAGMGAELLLTRHYFQLQPVFARIGLFDLEPKRSKTAHSVRGRAQLDPDAGNLSLVLRELLQDPGRREPFLRLLRDLLPFAEDLRVDEFPDRSILIALGERFGDLRSMPASFLSDGTLSLLALLVVLFFDDSPVVVIEEPEKNIHPHLISRLVGLMKEASRHKQLIVTTHNPQLLRHADLEDILLVQRDRDGFSRISRPADSQEVRTFVENDLGADELFVQNLLGVGNEV